MMDSARHPAVHRRRTSVITHPGESHAQPVPPPCRHHGRLHRPRPRARERGARPGRRDGRRGRDHHLDPVLQRLPRRAVRGLHRHAVRGHRGGLPHRVRGRARRRLHAADQRRRPDRRLEVRVQRAAGQPDDRRDERARPGRAHRRQPRVRQGPGRPAGPCGVPGPVPGALRQPGGPDEQGARPHLARRLRRRRRARRGHRRLPQRAVRDHHRRGPEGQRGPRRGRRRERGRGRAGGPGRRRRDRGLVPRRRRRGGRAGRRAGGPGRVRPHRRRDLLRRGRHLQRPHPPALPVRHHGRRRPPPRDPGGRLRQPPGRRRADRGRRRRGHRAHPAPAGPVHAGPRRGRRGIPRHRPGVRDRAGGRRGLRGPAGRGRGRPVRLHHHRLPEAHRRRRLLEGRRHARRRDHPGHLGGRRRQARRRAGEPRGGPRRDQPRRPALRAADGPLHRRRRVPGQAGRPRRSPHPGRAARHGAVRQHHHLLRHPGLLHQAGPRGELAERRAQVHPRLVRGADLDLRRVPPAGGQGDRRVDRRRAAPGGPHVHGGQPVVPGRRHLDDARGPDQGPRRLHRLRDRPPELREHGPVGLPGDHGLRPRPGRGPRRRRPGLRQERRAGHRRPRLGRGRAGRRPDPRGPRGGLRRRPRGDRGRRRLPHGRRHRDRPGHRGRPRGLRDRHALRDHRPRRGGHGRARDDRALRRRQHDRGAPCPRGHRGPDPHRAGAARPDPPGQGSWQGP